MTATSSRPEKAIESSRPARYRNGIDVLALTAALLTGVGVSSAATLHVDKLSAQCSDSGPGSPATPFCTINRGATVAVAGDTVLVHSGSYSENVRFAHSGTSSAPIAMRPATGAAVTVTSGTTAFEVSGRSWLQIDGFTVSGTVDHGISIADSSHIAVTGSVVTGSGRPSNGRTEPAIYVTNSTDCTISGNNLHHNSDAGVYLSGGSTRILVASNVSSYNARGYTRAAPGIDVRSGGNTIRGNICHHNEDSGIQVYGDSGTPSPNNVIVNNVCYNNGDHGIDVSSAGSQKIIGNSVYLSVTSGINVEGPSSGSLVANNISVDNGFGTGKGNIRVDPDSTSGTVVDYDVVYLSQAGETQVVWGSSSYASLSAFVAATGQETHGKASNPQWVSAPGANFHLTAASPAIDCANSGASGALSSDLEGLPRVDLAATPNSGAGPRTYDDRGAYELQPIVVCGNGIREAGEACDGADLGGATCATSGFFCGSGSGLACNANCTLDVSTCVASCPAGDACHTAGTCNAAIDRCTTPTAPDGTACNDGNACTQTDTCQSGLCTGSNAVSCTPSDPCHNAGLCAPETGLCSNPPVADGTTCDDGNACTHSDACAFGVCAGSLAVTCTASDACHEAGVCDTETGACSNPLGVDGSACDDGNVCTTNDACLDGACAGWGVELPGEVDDGVQLTQIAGITTIAWNPAPRSAWYELARGLVSRLPAGPIDVSDGVCLGNVILTTSATDAQDPEADEAFWYLIRGASACGAGPYGFQLLGGAPVPRSVEICQ